MLCTEFEREDSFSLDFSIELACSELPFATSEIASAICSDTFAISLEADVSSFAASKTELATSFICFIISLRFLLIVMKASMTFPISSELIVLSSSVLDRSKCES